MNRKYCYVSFLASLTLGALTTFKTDLKRFVADTRAKGATPIIHRKSHGTPQFQA